MLLFLDIDGVMVPAKGWTTPEILPDGFAAFSTTATRVLQGVISEDVTVLITSSHKSRFTCDEWRMIFKNHGIEIKNLEILPSLKGERISRKDEILNWFKFNSMITSYIIIDDDTSLQDLPSTMKANLVQPSSTIGLSESHIELINTILSRATKVA
jgi:hypothetical protein